MSFTVSVDSSIAAENDLEVFEFASFREFADSVLGECQVAEIPDWHDKHDVDRVKLSGEVLVAGEVRGKRSDESVRTRHALTADYDALGSGDAGAAAASRLLDALDSSGLEYAVHSTFKHGAPDAAGLPIVRLRVWLPFARPVSAIEYKTIEKELYAALPEGWDRNAKNLSRANFAPRTPYPEAFDYVYREGAPIDVDAMIRRGALAPAPTPKPPRSLKSYDLEAMRERISKRVKYLKNADPRRAQVEAILRGEAFAEPGQSNASVIRLSLWLASKIPDADIGSWMALWEPAVAAQRASGSSLTFDEVERLMGGAIAKAGGSVDADKLLAKLDPRREDVPADEPSRPDPNYLEACAQYAGVDPESEPTSWPWVLRSGDHFFFLTSIGWFGPYRGGEADTVAEKMLRSAPIETQELGRDGFWKYKGREQLAREYGWVIRKILADVSAEKSRWDPHTSTLWEATAPKNPLLDAKKHEDVIEWLEKIAGGDPAFLDWIATVTMTDKQTRVLSLVGPASSGKTLLATGLAKNWQAGGYAKADSLTGNFNGAVMRCPFVFADEETKLRLAQIRQITGGEIGSVNEKFEPIRHVKGFPRLMIAANDLNHFMSREALSAEAQAATAIRFLHYEIDDAAAKFLETIPKKRRQEWADFAIAETSLWLAANRAIDLEGRFAGRSGGKDVSAEIAVMSSAPATTSEILIDKLLSKRDAGQFVESTGFAVSEGRVYFVRKWLVKQWAERDGKSPEPWIVSSGISAIAKSEANRKNRREQGVQGKWIEVDPSRLYAYAERSRYATVEDLKKAVGAENAPAKVIPIK